MTTFRTCPECDTTYLEVSEHPLNTPAGTPFIASVCDGIPQLVVRTHHIGDLQAWWYLNGTEWVQTDHVDLANITPLTTETP